jgi:hypothetical protein
MLRIVVCSAVTLAIMEGLREAVHFAYLTLGTVAGTFLCVATIGCFLVIGAAMDRAESRRLRAEQPPEQPYSHKIDL